ncbi:MAG: hypothetical protein KatS3mg131_0988 [Candidatus Tectimicrobiota bacterium]|nr:MAG: hypothetical protein KatS3mg131_0988 [Candidatus Tectomicrobia bacterium]
MVAGSLLALAQRDVRRMLAYSSVGQMGYIVLGLSLGNAAALTGALLHVFAHAVMKGCLFLVAGGVQWRSGDCRLEAFLGLSRRLPLSTAAFVVAALSMVGLPPTAGFFSKWYLLLGAVQARAWPAVGALVLSSLLGAVYFFRLVEYAYLRPAPETLQRRELPVPMLAPIAVLAASLLLLGLLHQSALVPLIQRALPEVL